jgi:hypothetical protein
MFSSLVSKLSSASSTSVSESQSAASSLASSPSKPRRKFMSSSTRATPHHFSPVQTNKKVVKTTVKSRTSSHDPTASNRAQKPPVPKFASPAKPAISKTPKKTVTDTGAAAAAATKKEANSKLLSKINFSNFNSIFSEKLKVSTDYESSGSECGGSSSSNNVAQSENQTAQSIAKASKSASGNKVFERREELVAKMESRIPKTEPQKAVVKSEPVKLDRFADEPEYRMNHARRGYAVIINNRRFESMPSREGTDVDAACLEATLRRLHFDIKMFRDCTAASIRNLLAYYSKLDHSDSDCFLCVILSHGENGIVYGIDRQIEIEELTKPFMANRSLAGKPKLFVIQACRGSNLMSAIDSGPFEVHYVSRIPMEADFLMCYSTVAGFYSWRNSQNGSWFIQSLCAIFDEYAEELEVMQLLTMVNRRVAFYFESNASEPSMSGKRQVPCIVSMLTKELYFRKKSHQAHSSSTSYA